MKEPTKIIRKLSRSTPRLAPAYNNRGIIRQIRGDLNGAIADYTRAIELDRNYGLAYVNRASARRLRGDVGAALEDLNQAISRSKVSRSKADLANAFRLEARNLNLAVAHHERGALFLAKGDFAKALADFDRAIEINRRFPEAHYQPRHRPARPGRLEGALSDYDRAISLDPNLAEAYNQRGVVRQARGDLDGAIADYSRSIDIDPRSAHTYCNRANARQARGT